MRLLPFLVFLLIGCAQLGTKKYTKVSVLQGITNSREVEFSIVAESSKELTFELRSQEGDILKPEEIKLVERDTSNYSVHKIIFARDPQREYNLFIYHKGTPIDQRLVGRGQRKSDKLRLAAASGANDYYEKAPQIWDTLASKSPEYLVLVGNVVYTDAASPTTVQVTSPDLIWKRYVEMRFNNPLFFREKLIPIHAVWSDHDYGVKNGNENFSHKKESKDIFEIFFAQDLGAENWTKSPANGGLLNLGDFNLFFLDGRSFRSHHAEGMHLGLDQSAWFYSKLKEEPSPAFIIKGDQFFGGHHSYGSYEGDHALDFSRFIGELKIINTPFVFLTGSPSMSEIMQFPRSLFGIPSFEITTGPIQENPLLINETNPWRVVGASGKNNFIIIDNLAQDDHWFLDVTSFGPGGETQFRRELAVFIKDLQNNLIEIRKKRRSGQRRYRKAPRRKKR